jgi:hypothetical protein
MKARFVATLLLLAACGTLSSCRPGAGLPQGIPSSITPLSQAELKYRLIDHLGTPLFCDPDLYPVARFDQRGQALQHFPEIQRDQATYAAILQRHRLTGHSLTEQDKITVYQDWKLLNAIPLAADGVAYRFQGVFANGAASGNAVQALAVSGTIDPAGRIQVATSTPSSKPACPICLPAGALIDTPNGRVRAADVVPGLVVWTSDGSGARLAVPVLRAASVPVPPGHKLVSLLLEDGRRVQASPGHPAADGRHLGDLKPGDRLDGSRVIDAARVVYEGRRTFDLLPAGPTGTYWVDGVALGSTLAG